MGQESVTTERSHSTQKDRILAIGHSVDPQPHGAAELLVGRGRELDVIGSFLDAAAVEGRALLLFGDAGAGKTALMNAAAEMASQDGTRILRTTGVEFEAEVDFSGLNQVLVSLSGKLDNLSAAHRDALSVALGLTNGTPFDHRAVFTATLALLRRAAEAQSVLLIADDVHWLDRASAGALRFIAGQLAGTRVGIIAASRSPIGSVVNRAGVSTYEVRALDTEAAEELVDARFPSLGKRVRQGVLEEAQGNPLALLAFPAALDGRSLGSTHGLPWVLPVARRLQTLFASRIRGFPAATSRLLLLAALDGTGDLAVLEAASGADAREDLLPALRAELVAVDAPARRLTFRHPLVRATVVALSTSSARREAHRALAGALGKDPGRRAWHLAEATIGADERVAAVLERAAREAMQHGDAVGAVAAGLRAAELSPIGPERGRRLALAAYVGADVAGELRDASRRLVGARESDPEVGGSLAAAVATAHLLINEEGDVDSAHRVLVEAIETRGGHYDANDNALIEALYTLLTVCFFGGRDALWEPFHAALARLTPEPPVLLSLCASLFADPARATPAEVDELEARITRIGDDSDPLRIVRLGRASFFVDRMAACREAHWRIVRDGREGGAVTAAIYALMNLCFDDYLTGDWDEALQLADEALALCASHGYHLLAWPFRFGKAIVAAARGDGDTTSALADEMDRWAAPRQAGMVQLYARHARALGALARGDHERAYHDLAAISPPGRLRSHVPLALWAAMDLVTAAARTERHAEAISHSHAMRDARVSALSPRLALLSLGSAAIASRDENGLNLFKQALAVPSAERWPFDLARVQLAYGERLRRAHAKAEARVQLNTALETFRRLGAQPWAAHAANELQATGLTGAGPYPGVLSPQERLIAEFAAAGLTNREIGQRLFLSHRTVGGHLYRVFPKLGISSRAALRGALDAEESRELEG